MDKEDIIKDLYLAKDQMKLVMRLHEASIPIIERMNNNVITTKAINDRLNQLAAANMQMHLIANELNIKLYTMDIELKVVEDNMDSNNHIEAYKLLVACLDVVVRNHDIIINKLKEIG